MFFKSSGPVSWLIVFLGNPGLKYDCTRHNAGFMAGDALAKKMGVSVDRLRFKALTAAAEIGGEKVLLMKPQTFMNLSGEAVSEAARFYKIPPERVLVVSDEVSLPLGKLRVRPKGSAGGHNGMQNIIEQLGTQNIVRLRLGIGPKPAFFEGKDFVLSKFKKEELPLLKQALEKTLTALEKYFSAGSGPAMTIANAK